MAINLLTGKRLERDWSCSISGDGMNSSKKELFPQKKWLWAVLAGSLTGGLGVEKKSPLFAAYLLTEYKHVEVADLHGGTTIHMRG
jgi:hypothetical protein